jgi:hypothetical protein
VAKPELARDRGTGSASNLIKEHPLGCAVVRMHDRITQDVMADSIPWTVSKQPFYRRRLVDDGAFGVEKADHLRGVLEQGTEQLFAGHWLHAVLFVHMHLAGLDLGIVFANPIPYDHPHTEPSPAGSIARQFQTDGQKVSICSRTGH